MNTHVTRRARVVLPLLVALAAGAAAFPGHDLPASGSAQPAIDPEGASAIAWYTGSSNDGQLRGRVYFFADSLTPANHGALAFLAPAGSPPEADRRLTMSVDSTGRFAFPRQPSGVYRLTVRRIGYQPARAHVRLSESEGIQATVVLALQVVRLTDARR